MYNITRKDNKKYLNIQIQILLKNLKNTNSNQLS